MKYLTVEDISDFEEGTLVNSPRSIEACLREGIKPKDLLYIPPDEFQASGFPEDIKRLHYEFFEAKRREMLANVRKTRKVIISEQEILTRSSTAVNSSCIRPKKKVERFKAVIAKAICDRCEREEIVEKSLKINEGDRNSSFEKIWTSNASQAQSLKQRNDKAYKMHIERVKKAQEEVDTIKENQKAYTEKHLKELGRIIRLQSEKIKEINDNKEKHEMKTKEYCEKMMAMNQKIQDLRKANYEESDLQEKVRIEQIILDKIKKQKELEEKWNAKLKRTSDLKEKIQEDLMKRQIE